MQNRVAVTGRNKLRPSHIEAGKDGYIMRVAKGEDDETTKRRVEDDGMTGRRDDKKNMRKR